MDWGLAVTVWPVLLLVALTDTFTMTLMAMGVLPSEPSVGGNSKPQLTDHPDASVAPPGVKLLVPIVKR